MSYYVSSGQVSSGISLSNWHAMYVSSGGTADSNFVNSGGWMYVSSGGTANNTAVNSYGSMHICSGGTADSTMLNARGFLVVESGGTANNTIVNSRGSMRVLSGCTANSIDVNGGRLYINGGDLISVSVHAGGHMDILSLVSDVTLEDYSFTTVSSSGILSGAKVGSRAILLFSSGEASDTTVLSGGRIYATGGKLSGSIKVSRGGIFFAVDQNNNAAALDCDLNLAGELRTYDGLFSGCLDAQNHTILLDLTDRQTEELAFIDNLERLSNFTLSVSVSGTQKSGIYQLARNAADFSGTISVCSPAGSCISLAVGDSAVMDSQSYQLTNTDGLLALTVVNSGTQTTADIPDYTPGTWSTDWKQASAYAKAHNLPIFAYYGDALRCGFCDLMNLELFDTADFQEFARDNLVLLYDTPVPERSYNGSPAVYILDENGNRQAMKSGFREGGHDGWMDWIKLQLGKLPAGIYVYSESVLSSYGMSASGLTLTNYSSGLVVSATLTDAAVSGSRVNDTLYKAYLHLKNGGIAHNTRLDFQGNLYISSGGTATGTLVNSGGRLYVSYGGAADDTTVSDGGNLYVSSGGTADSTTVNDSGRLYVSDGGTANDTLVNSGGRLYVFDGTANNTTLNKSFLNVGGGMANSTVINLDCMLTVSRGMANNTTINGGTLLLYWDADFPVDPHELGSGQFQEAPTANSTTVNSGGHLQVHSGVVNNATVSSGGNLFVWAGKIKGSLQIDSGGSVACNNGSVLEFDISGLTANSSALVNDLSLIKGVLDYSITVSADQAVGVYSLADGADGFDEAVTVCNTDGVCGSLKIGGSVTMGGRDYTLNLDSGLLTLTVSVESPIPPAPVVGGTAGDLNMDGRADIVMTIDQSTHPADGATGAWLIQEDQTPVWGDLSTRNAGWVVFGTGKTAAGRNTDDVYIKSEGNIVGAWTTDDDGKVTGWETIEEFNSDAQVLGLGDFNGSGQSDLLLRAANGAVGCFFTDGQGWNYFQSLGDEWKLAAIGDLNGDGRDDVVLKHDAGFAGSWLIQEDGTPMWADLDTLPEGFEIAGAGDFNGDGTDDVLLKNGGYYGAWLVRNGNAAGWMGLGDFDGAAVEQIGDFNGDGVDDLRIRTSAGDLGAQLVMGADTLDWKYYGSVGAEWSTSLAALS